MTFLIFTLTRRPVFTGEYDANDEPICRKSVSTVRINAANIVSIETRCYEGEPVDGIMPMKADLIIKTVDGDTWSFPGTTENLHNVRAGVANANA